MSYKKLIIIIILFFTFFKIYTLTEYSSLLETGINDYKKGQYTFAINNLKKYIQTAEENTKKSEAYYYLALSYYFTDDYRLALHYIKELSVKYRLSTFSSQALFWKGLIYQNLGQWSNAEESFIKYVSIMPKSELTERAYLAAGNCELVLEKYSDAEKNLKILITDFKNSEKYEEASVLYSYILLINERYNEAEDFLTSWIGRLGETGDKYNFKDRFWLYRGEISYIKKEYDIAEVLFKKIDNYAKNSPSSDIALLRLSQISEKKDRLKDSKTYLLRLANEFPGSQYNIDASLSMGIKEFNNKDYTEALVFFNESKKLAEIKLKQEEQYNPREIKRINTLRYTALYYTGEVYENQNKTEKAIEIFNEIIEKYPELRDKSVLKIIKNLMNNENTTELNRVILKYNNSLLKNPEYKDEFLLYKAKLDYLNGNYDSSIRSLESIEKKPELVYSIYTLQSKNLIMLGKQDNALEILEELISISPAAQKPFISYEIINLNFNLKKYKDAIQEYLRLQTFIKFSGNTNQIDMDIKSNYLYALSNMQLRNNNLAINIFNELSGRYSGIKLKNDLQVLINKSYYYMGWLYYKNSDYIKAADNFAIAKKLNLSRDLEIDSIFMEAYCYFSKNDYHTAALKFKNILENSLSDEMYVKAFFMIGKSRQNSGKLDQSKAIYNEIYNNYPDSDFGDDALYEIIKLNITEKNYTEANKLSNIFNSKYPDSPLYKNVLILLGEYLLTAERYSEALSIYDYYLKKYRDNIDENVYYWAGYCAFKAGNYNKAADHLEKINEGSAFFINALNILKDVYNELKNYKEEKQVLIKLLADDKNNKQYLDRLEVIKLLDQGFNEHEASLINKTNNGDIEAKLQLGLYYYEKGSKNKAIELFKEITAEDKGESGARANIELGNQELINNNYEEAIKIFLKNISYYNSSDEIKAESLYKTAFCYHKLNKKQSALKILDTLNDKFKNSEWTKKGNELKNRISE